MLLHLSVPSLYGGIRNILVEFFHLACTLEDIEQLNSDCHTVIMSKVVSKGKVRVCAEGENKELYIDLSLQNFEEKELFAGVIEDICQKGKWKNCGILPDGKIIFKASRDPSKLVTINIDGRNFYVS